MGKTIDLFEQIRDIKGTFHARMGSIKDRNGMDLTEAEDIKKQRHYFANKVPSSQSCGFSCGSCMNVTVGL